MINAKVSNAKKRKHTHACTHYSVWLKKEREVDTGERCQAESPLPVSVSVCVCVTSGLRQFQLDVLVQLSETFALNTLEGHRVTVWGGQNNQSRPPRQQVAPVCAQDAEAQLLQRALTVTLSRGAHTPSQVSLAPSSVQLSFNHWSVVVCCHLQRVSKQMLQKLSVGVKRPL